MANLDWVLELVLVGLLGLTMVHAIRLERALRALRSDRAAFGEAIAGFDDSTRQAELGMVKLQAATAESAQMVARRVEQATSLRDDLAFLTERGEALADRLDGLVRMARDAASPPAVTERQQLQPVQVDAQPKVRSQAERDLLLALRRAQ
jgi:hypothetical protein